MKGSRGNGLTDERIAMLDEIGFEWGSARTPEQRWEINFKAVRKFYEDHKRWPVQKKDGAIGNWCMSQRQAKKRRGSKITADQVRKLDEIGFEWSPGELADERWDENVTKMRIFFEEHKRWPTQMNDGALGMWCHRQRIRKRGTGAKLTAKQVAQLDEIGFEWGTSRAGSNELRWEGNFEMLKQFIAVEKRWPKRDEALGTWCHTQRQAKKSQGHNSISQERIAKLDGIGFPWVLRGAAEEPSRKRVHKGDEEYAPYSRPKAAMDAFWRGAPKADTMDL